MGILRQLILVEAAALAALLVVAGAMAAFGAADSLLNANSLLGQASSAKVGFGYTVIFGLLPATLIGAPGYVTLLRHNFARLQYVLLLGILPGLIVLPFHLSFGFWTVICGAGVAFLTHLMCHRLGPNYSFKRTAAPKYE